MKTFTNLIKRASLSTFNMKRYYLFIIMLLTLGIGHAWGAEATVYTSNVELTTTSGTKATASKANISNVDYNAMKLGSSGNAGHFYVNLPANTTSLTLHAAAWNNKNSNTLTLSTETAGVTISPSTAQTLTANSGVSGSSTTYTITPNNTKEFFTYTITGATSGAKIKLACSERCLIWGVNAETSGATPPTSSTTYTIKWHTAVGKTTDVTLNEGAAITKPATDPTMTGYTFMGWTDQCNVATNGAGFTALSDFGTADSDKDFYAVFAVAETTGGGGNTTGSKTLVSSSNSTYYQSGYITGVSGTNSASWTTDGFTMVQNKNSSSSAVALNYAEIRVYASHSIAFTPSTGSTITSIVATATTDAYATALGGSSIGNCTKSVSGSVVTITPTDGTQEVTIANSVQSRLKTIVVNYTTSGGGTTTYSDYITTCASDIELVELGDDFKWSATEAGVTIDATDNVFPDLTNTHNVPVTYSSSDETIASIAADGTVTLNKEGTVTITAKYAGGTSAGTGKEYKAKTVTYSLKVNKAAPVASGTTYVKVTSTAGITDGEYLIVYEEGKVAFNGALTDLDAVGNTIEVTINNNTIAGTNYIDAATFTIDVTNGTILSASGKYIGKTANSNGLDVKTTAMTNTFAIDANGNAVITGNTAALRYNKAADQKRFRYYKDGGGSQEKIALYKKASKHTVTLANCTNGSVSAKMGETALVTNDQVLSGIQITLNNNPADNYKLVAYDVYKTGEESTKVTETEGKFIMPEHDVTISATFEQLKELDKIEVNTTNVKKTFWQGETFNSTGLVVTAYYTDKTSTAVIPNSITGSTAEAGTKQVTVSYTEGDITKETKYDITVKAIANNEETPYTVIEAREIIDAVGETTVDVYVQGIVSKIVTAYNSEYGNISYNISEDGKTTSAQLQAYRGKSYNGDNFTSADDIQVDDKVVVKGKLKKHDSTYEFAQDNQLVSLVRSTEPKPTAATLPFEFDGNKDDIADVIGMSQTGLGTYDSSPKLKFDTENDNVIIHFDSEPGEFSFALKQNGQNAGMFTVYESVDGEDYTSVWSGGNLGNGQTSTIESTLSSTARYVKFELTTKGNSTNYGLGQISIKKIDKRQEAGLAWNPATVSLTVGDAFTAPTLSNPKGLAGITFTSDNEALATVTDAGVISLVRGKTGTATITATFADGHADYKPAEVTCTIIVNHKSEDVVILAKCKDQYYALVAENLKSDVLKALPVEYVGGKIYNVETEDQASIIWKRVVVDGKTTFKNGDNYLSAVNSAALNLATEACEWVFEGDMYKIEGSTRTILYYTSTGGFKNYSTTNMSNDGVNGEYSSAAITVAPVFADGDAYHRTVTPGYYGTICLPYGSSKMAGATFYETSHYKDGTVYFNEVTTLVAGHAYIFLARANQIEIYKEGDETVGAPVVVNGLHGTFTKINDVAAESDVAEEYIIVYNSTTAQCELSKCITNCWLDPYRAYVVISEIGTTPKQPMPGCSRVGMAVEGENGETGFDNIQLPNANSQKLIINGQLIIIRDGEMYNAQGVRL